MADEPPATLAEVRHAVDVAAGRAAGSLLLQNARLLNVFTNAVEPGHVLLAGRLVAAVGESVSTTYALRNVPEPSE